MTTKELKLRTKKFSLEIIDLVEKLPNSIAGRTISNQIIRSVLQLEQTTELYVEQEAIESLFLK